jgi:hypothetical protein
MVNKFSAIELLLRASICSKTNYLIEQIGDITTSTKNDITFGLIRAIEHDRWHIVEKHGDKLMVRTWIHNASHDIAHIVLRLHQAANQQPLLTA